MKTIYKSNWQSLKSASAASNAGKTGPDREAGQDHLGLGSAAIERTCPRRGGAVPERPEAIYYDKYPIHDLAWAQEYCGRLGEVTVGDLEQQGEEHRANAVHQPVTVQHRTELDEAIQI